MDMNRGQLCNDRITLAAISAFALFCSTIVLLIDPESFERFLGSLHPLLAFLAASFLAFFCYGFFLKRGWLVVIRPVPARLIGVLVGLAVLFAAMAIAVDVITPFPEEMNVAFPVSLFYYPAMAFLAETVFHLVPLVVLLLLLCRMSGDGRWIWPALLLAAMIEPAFQVVIAAPENADLSLRDIWVGFHVLAINLVLVILLNRFGFLVAYSFRVAYYLLWHVAWGFLRIQVLF